MTETVTIQGQSFTVHPPYSAGHVLQENEAATLNQTWIENIRNNFARTVSQGMENGTSVADLQAQLDQYAEQYVFLQRTGGGRTTDPVEQEARRLAKAHIIAKLKQRGETSKYTSEAITQASRDLLAHEVHGPKLRKKAAANVDEIRRAAAADLGDDDFTMPESDE